MGKINLCIAASLDGFIADSKGSVAFLFEQPRVQPDPAYQQFFENVENILFGSVSYRQIAEEMSPGKWMYPGKTCYVFTSQTGLQNDDVIFTNSTPQEFVQTVADKTDGITWLFGGRRLIRSFMEEDLIDQYWIYTMPVLLGEGVPLFTPPFERKNLRLASVGRVDDIVQSFYERNRS